MIIRISESTSYDTERDLTPAERHVLQKLFLWKSMATSLKQFRDEKNKALQKGWNDSGPIQESTALREIIRYLEKQVMENLSKNGENHSADFRR
ncbi:MAG: hypothetical protein DRH12_03915 [Deltaproteobacteria bacterium]|nr:MAG: hypothetical protein DRH12_03915 [Deltaproteobacteria bacterium]